MSKYRFRLVVHYTARRYVLQMSKQQLFPDVFYLAQREAERKNAPVDIHKQLRSIKCACCLVVVPKSQWKSARSEREHHLPYNESLLRKVQQVFPSYTVTNPSLPTSLCSTCIRKLTAAVSMTLSENRVRNPDSSSKSRTRKCTWDKRELLEIDNRFSIACRQLRDKSRTTCSGPSCEICVSPKGVPKHNYQGPLGKRRSYIAQKKLRASSKKRRIPGRPRGKKSKNCVSETPQPPRAAKPTTRSCDTPLQEINTDILAHKRRKRTIIFRTPKQPPKNLSPTDTGASARAIARGAEGQRLRAKDQDAVSAPSGAKYRQDSSYYNKAFKGDFESRPFEISSDGHAYFVKNPSSHVKKLMWLSRKVVRSLRQNLYSRLSEFTVIENFPTVCQTNQWCFSTR